MPDHLLLDFERRFLPENVDGSRHFGVVLVKLITCMNGSEVSINRLNEFNLGVLADSFALNTGCRVSVEDAFDILSVLSFFLGFFVI